MSHRSTVVSERQPLTKPQCHSLLMQGWTRAIAKNGKGAFADKLEISGPALDKQLTGSMPSFEVIDKALDACPTVLDEYLSEKGKRLVDSDAVCDVDDLGLLLSRVLVMLNEAEHPEGPGGRSIVPQEYLAGENLMRELHAASGKWLQRCSSIRQPLRSVG